MILLSIRGERERDDPISIRNKRRSDPKNERGRSDAISPTVTAAPSDTERKPRDFLLFKLSLNLGKSFFPPPLPLHRENQVVFMLNTKCFKIS